MAQSITSLTKQLFEEHGYCVGKTEHWNSFAHKKFDLFNFADCVAIKMNLPIIAIQITTTAHANERKDKIEGIEEARIWASFGWVMICTWRKLKVPYLTATGKRRIGPKYIPRVERYCGHNNWVIESYWQDYWTSKLVGALPLEMSESEALAVSEG